MFETFKDIGKLAHLATRAQQMQQQMKQLQEQLASERVTGDAGAGRVTATVNGRLELISIHIDPTRVDATNIALLENLVTNAVCTAQYQATNMMREKMEKMAADLGITPDVLPGGGM